MRGRITKIDPEKIGSGGDPFSRVYLEMEDGSFAMTDLCPLFRNYKGWEPHLHVGVTLDYLEYKSKGKVNADSIPAIAKVPLPPRPTQPQPPGPAAASPTPNSHHQGELFPASSIHSQGPNRATVGIAGEKD